MAVKENGWALKYADKSLKSDKEIVLAAVKENGYVLKYADKSLKSDKEIVLAAVKENGYALEYADESLKKDKEVVLAAKEFVLAAVKQDGWALWRADESLKKGPEILSAYFGPSLSAERYKELSDDLNELDIGFPERFDINTLLEIIQNRKNLEKKEAKPLAVIIYPKADWNGAFQKNQMKELIKRGYRVVYFEAGDENTVYSSLKAATIDVDTKADLFVLGGHGTQTHTAMGAGDPAKGKIENEEFYINISDKEEMMALKDSLNEGSVVILDSCSSGKGKESADNTANLMKSVFPQSTVFAPTVPTSVEKYEYDSNNRVVKPIYKTLPKNVYSTEK